MKSSPLFFERGMSIAITTGQSTRSPPVMTRFIGLSSVWSSRIGSTPREGSITSARSFAVVTLMGAVPENPPCHTIMPT